MPLLVQHGSKWPRPLLRFIPILDQSAYLHFPCLRHQLIFWLAVLHILEGTSKRNPREALAEKNAADLVMIPPGASSSRGRQGMTSGSSCDLMHLTNHVAHLERIQTWSTIRTMNSRARRPRCAPQEPAGDAHEAGNKET